MKRRSAATSRFRSTSPAAAISKEAIKLTAAGLPNEIKPKEVNLDGNTADGKFELQLNQQNIKPGTYTFYMQGETKRKYVRNPDAVPAAEAEQKAITEMIAKLTEDAEDRHHGQGHGDQGGTGHGGRGEDRRAEEDRSGQQRRKRRPTPPKQAADTLTKAKEAAAKDTANAGLADAAKAAETAANDAAAAQKKAEEELAAADKALIDAQAAAKTADEARVASKPRSRPRPTR